MRHRGNKEQRLASSHSTLDPAAALHVFINKLMGSSSKPTGSPPTILERLMRS
jgi:hypothetical protein